MKMKTAVILGGILLFQSCSNNTQKTESSDKSVLLDTTVNESGRLLPKQLRYMPFGIVVQHEPNPCYPELENGKYVWKHNTTLRANKDLEIIEYGSFVYTKKGWYLRVTNDTKFFDEHYGTKNGKLKKDSVYTDPLSVRYSDSLFAGDAMWYYIAKDSAGNRYKGIGPIETEGITLDELNKQKGLDLFSVAKSKIVWTGYGEIGDYALSGNLNLKNGVYLLSKDTLSSVKLIFDMQSISSDQEDLVNHLKGSDFFNSGEFPFAEFVLNQKVLLKDKMSVKGILTIKNIPNEISCIITHAVKNKKHVFKGKLSFDRTKFNIKYNSKSFFSNLGDQAIKNVIDVNFEIETI